MKTVDQDMLQTVELSQCS